MKRIILIALLFTGFIGSKNVSAQIDESAMGGWYMYFYSAQFGESAWGVQGDLQLRNWAVAGDLEQLLLRSGLTYKPKGTSIKFTLGYGNITTGAYGDSDETVSESRIYQEALFPTQFGRRFFLNHRFRYEQRFVDNQDFRTRYRYNLFANVALNKPAMEKNTIYLALYNELFINGQRGIGFDRTVEIFDRNRFYVALGYMINKNLKTQLGIMKQTTDNWSKNQLQLSLHQNF